MSGEKSPQRKGVLLLNMGGPDSLAAVEPFLRRLFSDREIIRLGPFPFLQGFLARIIAARRAKKSRAAYQRIGGASPLLKTSLAQAEALSGCLAEHGEFVVGCAMRYSQPSAEQALKLIDAYNLQSLVALPLYPHYSRATSGSSLNDLRKTMAAMGLAERLVVKEIKSWPDQPDYIKALLARITEAAEGFAGEDFTLVYSAHSLPQSYIDAGDPYLEQIKTTITALEKRLNRKGLLCFQSRSGPVRWLSPSTPEMLKTLANQGVKNVLVLPISFVSDHIETLYEIDIEYAALAAGLGMRLLRVPGLNTHPRFIRALAKLVCT